MTKGLNHITKLLLSVLALSLALSPAAAFAATPSASSLPAGSGQALEIAPPVLTLSGNPGQVIKAQINLRDVSPENLLVTGQVNDFIAAGEDGTPKILMTPQDNNPFTLISWVAPLPSLNLVPKQIKQLPVTITIPANAAPGGHYGVIRFTARPPDIHDTGVSLSASLGALVLVTVNGHAKEGLSVAEFSVTKNGQKGSLFEAAPLGFTTRLKNTGNIHEEPTGEVDVKDMFGKIIASTPVNIPPRNILPASIRKFDSPLDSTVIGNKKLFGHYEAILKIKYGATTSKQSLTASTSFWVIPYRLIGALIVILVGGFFVLRFLIKRYNQRIITKAQGGGKNKK